MPISLHVDGVAVEVEDDGASLLEVLRDRLGNRSPKDGCSPQGQCGCCTVLVDGVPRVACVTPIRRMAGRRITTLAGFDAAERDRWADAFTRHGASQCGFCTPGIIVRLATLESPTKEQIEGALVAHLCRCTGWRTIVDAALDARPDSSRDEKERDWEAASRRATIEGGAPQQVGPDVALGKGGFADDGPPPDALVAVLDAAGEWVVAETLAEARAKAGKVQGRRTTAELTWPLDLPPGHWDVTLRTTWVEPAYLEPDASWCAPGAEPATSLANGGAFGGKAANAVQKTARALADQHQRPVRVVLAREDIVRRGPKRPPIAAGINRDGTGVIRVARTPGIAEAITGVAPGLIVQERDVPGPPTSATIRAAGWAEAAILLATATNATTITSPAGATATAEINAEGSIRITVDAGAPLDETVLRSYCIGAAHQALGWVTTEGIAVDPEGVPLDLTVRSFGIVRARDMPEVTVEATASDRPPVNGSDAVFAAVAAAVWKSHGLPPAWPTDPQRGASR